MKTITIPECMNPYVVIINNHTYSYPAGETVTVPRAVAEVIESHIDAMHSENPTPGGIGSGSTLDEKALIDKLAPAFKKTGAVVTCNPIEGHPLTVISKIKPKQNKANPNLLPDIGELIFDDSNGYGWMHHLTLDAGMYTLYSDISNGYALCIAAWNDDMEVAPIDGSVVGNGKEQATFYHNGGDAWLWDMGEAMFEEGGFGSQATIVKLEKGDEYTGTDSGESSYFPIAKPEMPKLTITNGADTQQIAADGVSIDGGTINWNTGEVGETWKILELSGKESWELDEEAMFSFTTLPVPIADDSLGKNIVSTHFRAFCNIDEMDSFRWDYAEEEPMYIMAVKGNRLYMSYLGNVELETAEYIAQQAANGTPVQIAYECAETVHSIEPQNIVALSGTTTVSCDSGTIEVVGKVSPATMFADIEARIAKLEAALLNG